MWLLLKPGPRPWTRTLKNLDSEKPGRWETCTQKNLDPEILDPENLGSEKPGPRKTWILKNVDPEIHESWKTWSKYGIKKYVWPESYVL